jgi:hypothetical protein
MFEARGPQETAGHVVAAPEPSWQGGIIQSRGTHGGPKPSSAGRQDLELYDTRHTGALHCREAGSRATDTW